MVCNQCSTCPHHDASVWYIGLYVYHFGLISIPGAVSWKASMIFTILLPSSPPTKSQLHTKPIFSGHTEDDVVLTASCIFHLQNLWKPCLKKWYMARKRPSPSNLIRSLHCSAGFQEDRRPRQLDGNMNHTMLEQLSHIHSVTKIHLFIISCNTAWDKMHC